MMETQSRPAIILRPDVVQALYDLTDRLEEAARGAEIPEWLTLRLEAAGLARLRPGVRDHAALCGWRAAALTDAITAIRIALMSAEEVSP